MDSKNRKTLPWGTRDAEVDVEFVDHANVFSTDKNNQ